MWKRRRCSFVGGSVELSLLIILIYLVPRRCCKAYSSTAPTPSSSSCGHINNISCPFRLKGDHQKCDGFSYELSCLNNRTVLNWTIPHGPDYSYYPSLKLTYVKYYVEDINYDYHSVRVVDPGLDKDNYSCSSLPLYYLPDTCSDYFSTVRELNTPITFVDCPAPAISTRYIDTAPCSLSSSVGNNNNETYSYIVIGDMDWSEVEDSCTLRETTWVSLHWRPIMAAGETTTYRDIHDNGMVHYGFELPSTYLSCLNCLANGGDCDLGDYVCRYRSTYDPCDLSYTYGLLLYCSLRYNLLALRAWLIRERSNIGKIFGIFYIARFFLGTPFLLALIVYKLRRRHLSVYETIEDFLQGQTNLRPIRYNYHEIKKITNNFKDKLGEGGFGSVYKGKLRSGFLVAVKVLGKSKASGQEFISEVATIGRIHHVNVVQLLGFCFEGPKRALIYEFMPNGSLEKYIFPQDGEEEGMITLSCEKMYDISFKVAGGVEYLHRGCDMQILHFDIKPHNILLDENFNPKISDFGLAKLYATDDSIVTLTAARGTMGYMAPELFYKNIGGVSYKADIYSFGMLLMEMAGRRKNLNPFVDNTSQIYFPSWIYDQFSEGKEIEMEDASEEERKLVKKMVIVALWCIQMKPSDRPSMNKVIEMLEGDVEILVMPPKPFLCPQESPVEDQEIECHQN